MRFRGSRPFYPTPRDIAWRVVAMLREAPIVTVVFADGRLWVTHRQYPLDDERQVAQYRRSTSEWVVENDIEEFFKEMTK